MSSLYFNFSFPLRAFIFLLILSTHFCMFSTFSTNVFTRLIAVILTSLSNNFYMYIMSEFLTCILCLSYIVMKIDLSLHTIIFLRFGMPCQFFVVSCISCTGKRVLCKQFFSVRIYVNLLEVRLLLVFPVAIEAKDLKFSQCPCFCLSPFRLP